MSKEETTMVTVYDLGATVEDTVTGFKGTMTKLCTSYGGRRDVEITASGLDTQGMPRVIWCDGARVVRVKDPGQPEI